MEKRIIVLTDLSDAAENIIRYAAEWNKRCNTQIRIVHQIHVLSPGISNKESKIEIADAEINTALEKLKELSSKFFGENNLVDYTITVEQIQNIVHQLAEEPFENILFAGIKNTGFLKKVFMGNTVLKIIDHTSIPLVALPEGQRSGFPEKIFIALAEQHPLNLIELKKILHWFPSGKTELVFFNISDKHENSNRMEQKLKELSGLYSENFKCSYRILKNDDVVSGIKNIIIDHSKEIVLVQKGSRFFSDLVFRKRMVSDLIYGGSTPLIVLP